jgi:hypothetical protein
VSVLACATVWSRAWLRASHGGSARPLGRHGNLEARDEAGLGERNDRDGQRRHDHAGQLREGDEARGHGHERWAGDGHGWERRTARGTRTRDARRGREEWVGSVRGAAPG